MTNELAKEARDSIIAFDADRAVDVARKAVGSNSDLEEVIIDGYDEGIRYVELLYEREQIYLPQIMASFSAFSKAMDFLLPHIDRQSVANRRKDTIVVCSVEGDIHSIGKNMVVAFLTMAGFNVINLGEDVRLENIAYACVQNKATVACISASMTSTMVNQKYFEVLLDKMDLKEYLITNVGGAPVTQMWANEIGADIYSDSAKDAVRKIVATIGHRLEATAFLLHVALVYCFWIILIQSSKLNDI